MDQAMTEGCLPSTQVLPPSALLLYRATHPIGSGVESFSYQKRGLMPLCELEYGYMVATAYT